MDRENVCVRERKKERERASERERESGTRGTCMSVRVGAGGTN